MSLVNYRNARAMTVLARPMLRRAFTAWKLAHAAAPYVRGAVNVAKKKVASRPRKPRASKKKLSQGVRQVGTGGSISKYSYGRRRMRRTLYILYRALAKQYFQTNSTLQLHPDLGCQSWTTVNSTFDWNDLDTVRALVPNNNETTKWCAESCSSEIQLSNLTDTNTRIVIWELIARRDLSSSNQYTTPTESFSNWSGDEGESLASRYMGFNPLTLIAFTTYYKVLKKTHILLAAGQSHSHRTYFAPNKVINNELLSENNIGYKGLTTYTMIQCFGVPASKTSDLSVTTITRPKVDVIVSKFYRFGAIANSQTTLHAHNNITAPANDADISTINVATGGADTETEV